MVEARGDDTLQNNEGADGAPSASEALNPPCTTPCPYHRREAAPHTGANVPFGGVEGAGRDEFEPQQHACAFASSHLSAAISESSATTSSFSSWTSTEHTGDADADGDELADDEAEVLAVAEALDVPLRLEVDVPERDDDGVPVWLELPVPV